MECSTARLLRPVEWPRLLNLLQQVHGRDAPGSYPSEYPLMLAPENAGRLFVIQDESDGSLVCHVGTLPRTLRVGPQTLPVALVGSVATHPRARRQGLARRCLLTAHASLAAEGFLLTLLWSEPRALYQELGYHPAGRCLLFQLTGSTGRSVDPTLRRRSARSEDLFSLQTLMQGRFSSLERSHDEHRILSGIPGMSIEVGEREGRVVAALYVGKGHDLRDIAHEWMGAPDDVLELAEQLQTSQGRALGLLTPGLPDPTARAALARGWPYLELPVAQLCALNPVGLVRALKPSLEPARAERLQSLAEGSTPTLEALPLIQQLFGPAPSPISPLPLTIFGLDSM